MAVQRVEVGPYLVDLGDGIIRFGTIRNLPRIEIIPALQADPNINVYFAGIDIRRTLVSLELSDDPNRGTSLKREDLSDAWEQNLRAIRVEAGGHTVWIPGPNSSAAKRADLTEPYSWNVDTEHSNHISDFITEWDRLTTEQKRATVITFDDGIPIPTISLASSVTPNSRLRPEVAAPSRTISLASSVNPNSRLTPHIGNTTELNFGSNIIPQANVRILSNPEASQTNPILPTQDTQNYDNLVSVKVYKAATYGVDDNKDGQHPKNETNDLLQWIFSFREERVRDEADELRLEIYKGSPWHIENVIQARDRIVLRRATNPNNESGDVYRVYRVRSVSVGTGKQSTYSLIAWSIDVDFTTNLYKHFNTTPLLGTDRGRSLRTHDFGEITVREALEAIFEESHSLPANFKLGYIAPQLEHLAVFPYFKNSDIADCIGIINKELTRHEKSVEYEIVYFHVAKDGRDAGDIVFEFIESRGASDRERKEAETWEDGKDIDGETNPFKLDIAKRMIVAPHEDAGEPNRIGATIQNLQDDYVSRVVPYITDEGTEIGVAGTVWDVESAAYDSGKDETVVVLEENCIGFDDQFNYVADEDGNIQESSWGIRDGTKDLGFPITHSATHSLGRVNQPNNAPRWADRGGIDPMRDWYVPEALVENGQRAYIRRLEIDGKDARITLELSGPHGETGIQLMNGWERSLSAITLTVPDRQLFLSIPGPNSEGANTKPNYQPYQWDLIGDYEVNRARFVDSWKGFNQRGAPIETILLIQWAESEEIEAVVPHRIKSTKKEPRKIMVAGEFSGEKAVFIEDSGGSWQNLDYLRRPDGENEQGYVIKPQEITDAVPYENLVERAGADANFDEYGKRVGPSYGIPEGWETFVEDNRPWGYGPPNTGPLLEPTGEFATNGRYTLKVDCFGKGMGVRVPFMFGERLDGPYLSVCVTLRVALGAVEMYVIDKDDNIYPRPNDDRAIARASENTVAFKIAGYNPAPGECYLYLNARGDGDVIYTEFYVDSVSVTASPTAWEYKPHMGTKDLWAAAMDYLLANGGIKDKTTQTEFVDLTRFSQKDLERIQVGSWVRLVDLVNVDGDPNLRLDGRVERIAESARLGSEFTGSFQKIATIGRQRESAYDNQDQAPERSDTPTLVPVPGTPTDSILQRISNSFYTWQDGNTGYMQCNPPAEVLAAITRFRVQKAVGRSLPGPGHGEWEEIYSGFDGNGGDDNTPGFGDPARPLEIFEGFQTSVGLHSKRESWIRAEVQIEGGSLLIREFQFDIDIVPEIQWATAEWNPETHVVRLRFYADEDVGSCVVIPWPYPDGFGLEPNAFERLAKWVFLQAADANDFFIDGNGEKEFVYDAADILPGQDISFRIMPFSIPLPDPPVALLSGADLDKKGPDFFHKFQIPNTGYQPSFNVDQEFTDGAVRTRLNIPEDRAGLVQGVQARQSGKNDSGNFQEVSDSGGGIYEIETGLYEKGPVSVQFVMRTPSGLVDIYTPPISVPLAPDLDGTDVVANPPGTDGPILHRVRIGGQNYNLWGGVGTVPSPSSFVGLGSTIGGVGRLRLDITGGLLCVSDGPIKGLWLVDVTDPMRSVLLGEFPPRLNDPAGIASHNGKLYVVSEEMEGVSGTELWEINSGRPQDSTLIGRNDEVHDPSGLASHNGELYVIEDIFDPVEDRSISVGILDPRDRDRMHGIAFPVPPALNIMDPSGLTSHNGKLYCIQGAPLRDLFELNLSSVVNSMNRGKFPAGLADPTGIASHNGKLYIVDQAGSGLWELTDPILPGTATNIGAFPDTLIDPSGLTSH